MATDEDAALDDANADTVTPPVHSESRLEGKALVVRLKDRMIIEPSKVEALSAEIGRAAVDHPHEICVIDMAAVDFISSTVLGMLVKLNRTFRGKGVSFRLCNVRPEIRNVLEAGRLVKVLDLRVDLADALSAI
jgi:anti-anti-sigma factor